eukprot:GILK01000239.1.p2 GENE.GILK01000239.1~~GILK01000239.1.p2  ORF type:complete len:107 (+),score=7.49 GILK01000239.1:616-936(+)
MSQSNMGRLSSGSASSTYSFSHIDHRRPNGIHLVQQNRFTSFMPPLFWLFTLQSIQPPSRFTFTSTHPRVSPGPGPTHEPACHLERQVYSRISLFSIHCCATQQIW